MINIRQLVESDFAVVEKHLSRKIWERADKPWTKHINPHKVRMAMQNELQHIHAVVIEETYVLAFSIFMPWFSDDSFVEEKLTVRALPGKGNFSDIVKALDHIARVSGAKGIVVGTAMAHSNKALSRLYAKHGYSMAQHGLYKGIA